MSGGGRWTVQNKIRPGAYINFVSVPRAVGTMGVRGTVAIAMPMSWGPEGELITLTGDMLLNGKSIPVVGCDAFDVENSLKYRVACAGSYTALLFRTDRGGSKAQGTVGEIEKEGEIVPALTITAKYNGVVGNKIIVAIEQIEGSTSYNVQVLFKDIKKETFQVETGSDLEEIESEYVDFAVDEEATVMPLTAGVALTGGTDGIVSADVYSTFMDALDHKDFQCMTVVDENFTSTLAGIIKDKVEIWRENRGKKVQAVVYNAPNMDYEGIISCHQGFKTPDETIDPYLFCAWVASMTAGAEINESLTSMVVENATEIINPVEEDDIADALSAGKFIITYRQDYAIIVEQDINSYHTFTTDKNYAFCKNRVMRTLDQIGNDVALIFNRNYCGKEHNNSKGRNNFKVEIIHLIDQMQSIDAIQNFEGATDIIIEQGENVDSVVAELYIQPVDSMEKLYLTVYVNA